MRQKLFGRKSFRLSDHELPYTSLLRVCDHAGLNGFDLEGKVAHQRQPVNDMYSWLVAKVSEELISGQKPSRKIITDEPPVPMHIYPLRSATKVGPNHDATNMQEEQRYRFQQSSQDAAEIRKRKNKVFTEELSSDIKRFVGLDCPLDKLYVDKGKRLSIAAVLHSDISNSLGPGRVGTKKVWLVAALRSHDSIVRTSMPKRLLEAVQPTVFWALLQAVNQERQEAKMLLKQTSGF